MEQVHNTLGSCSSWIELDARAVQHNLDQLAGIMGSVSGQDRKLGLVVKGNAYGHGLPEMVAIIARHPAVTSFFVASLYEALMLRKSGVEQEICALVPADSALLAEAIASDVQIVCPDIAFLSVIAAAARRAQKRARVHLKVDTGLSRLGVCGLGETLALAEAIKRAPEIALWGVMTHFADTAGDDLSFTREQQLLFKQIREQLRAQGFDWHYTHAGASGALDVTRDETLVRVGTLLYGYWKSPEQRARYQALGWNFDVKPVLSWKSRVFHVKPVAAGCSIGYGHDLFADSDKILAVVPVGYADGYPRALSNGGQVVIRGQLAPVIGRVSMNLLTVDVTGIAGVTAGDVVTLLGTLPGVLASDLAMQAGTVTLDILAGLLPTITRIVV